MGCDIHMFIEKKIGSEWMSMGEIDVNRNYDLFAFLAGVRGDGQHFARKGFPEDASQQVKEECWEYGSDGHSHSYLTLRELQTVNWDDETFMMDQEGIMPNEQWPKFEETVKAGKPDYNLLYPHWAAGGDPETSSYHEWQIPRKILLQDFNDKVMKFLPSLCIDCTPDEIRIVFWFDN